MTRDQADHIIKVLHQIAAAQIGMIDALAAIRLHQHTTATANENQRLQLKRLDHIAREGAGRENGGDK